MPRLVAKRPLAFISRHGRTCPMSSSSRDQPCSGCAHQERLGRRRFLGLLSAGLGLVLAGCTPKGIAAARARGSRSTGAPSETLPDAPVAPILNATGGPPLNLGAIPPAHPGSPQIISQAPAPTQQIALTVDDGYCADCITQYVAFVQRSGIHITFSPNGTFGPLWTPHVDVLRPLIAGGQVQIANHTWDHANLLALTDSAVLDELNHNESWIQSTFGITSRPYFRPPYGYHDSRIDRLAAGLGYTKVLMWNGSFGDSEAISPDQLISLAQQYLQPGTIMLGHANHPTILSLFPQVQAIIAQRNLHPVTLDEMFGTSRTIG
jgi:peptidoglycan-N-acetylglucosamine deacetylase